MATSPQLPQLPSAALPVAEILRANTELAIIVGPDGLIAWVSDAADVLLGRSPRAVVGGRLDDLVATPDRTLASTLGPGAVEIRLRHSTGRSVPMAVSSDRSLPGRTVLTAHDLTSWRVVQRALAGRFDAAENPIDDAPLPVLLLDAQLHARASSASWNELTGLAGEDPGLDWLYAIDPDSLERLQQALPVLCSGGSWRSTVWVFSTTLSARKVDLGIAASIGSRGQLLGFVVVGVAVGEVVTVQRPTTADATAGSALPSGREVSNAIAADPDRPIRMAIAAVLARANAKLKRTEDRSATTPEQRGGGSASAQSSRPPMIERTPLSPVPPGHMIDQTIDQTNDGTTESDPFDEGLGLDLSVPLIDLGAGAPYDADAADADPADTGRLPVDEPTRSDLFDHLETARGDGMAAVVSVALLFIDVLSTGAAEDSANDRRYNLRMLERRLRTTVRENEYAALLGDQGFVVATRGTFTPDDIDSLTIRLLAKLSTPLRGHQVSGAPQVCAGAAVSRFGESDADLVGRAEAARARAVTSGAGAIVIDAG